MKQYYQRRLDVKVTQSQEQKKDQVEIFRYIMNAEQELDLLLVWNKNESLCRLQKISRVVPSHSADVEVPNIQKLHIRKKGSKFFHQLLLCLAMMEDQCLFHCSLLLKQCMLQWQLQRKQIILCHPKPQLYYDPSTSTLSAPLLPKRQITSEGVDISKDLKKSKRAVDS